MIFGEMCVLSLIYSYVANVVSVQYVVSLLFAAVYFLITGRMFFNILLCFCLFCSFVLYFVYSLFSYCFSFEYTCLFRISIQVYRQLPPGGIPSCSKEI